MSHDRYRRVLHAVYGQPWAIQKEKLDDIVDLVDLRAEGVTLTPAEIRARLGGDPPDRRRAERTGSVAVLPVFGVLAQRMNAMTEMSGGTSTQMLAADVRAAVADPTVTAIALVVDSPGGTVAGATDAAAAVRQARDHKPIVAIVDTLAASCAYWIASQTSEVVITPTGQAGSIGVYLAHKNIAAALKQEGIEVTLISAGKHKTEGSPLAPLTADDRAALQRLVDASYALFVNDVAAGRGVTPAHVRSGFGFPDDEGRLLAAPDAVRAGLVDRIDTLEHVLLQLAQGGTVGPIRRLTAPAPEAHAAQRASLDHALRQFALAEALARPR